MTTVFSVAGEGIYRIGVKTTIKNALIIRTVNALTSLCRCADSSEHQLLAFAVSTKADIQKPFPESMQYGH